MSLPGNERRGSQRFNTDLPGTIGSGASVTCNVVNLSRTGALAICSHPIDEMTMVQISVCFADADGPAEEFSCEAAVVRSSPRPGGDYDLGLYFTSVSAAAREILERILASGCVVPV